MKRTLSDNHERAAVLQPHIYAIALGSNQPRSCTLTPKKLVELAIAHFTAPPFRLLARAPIIETEPLGPSKRRYANTAIMIEVDDFMPDELLRHLKGMERNAGRRRGQRWSSRPLDLDIITWNGGMWNSPELMIPHKEWSNRLFVLTPLSTIAPTWRDPKTGKSVRQMLSILKKPKKVWKDG